MQVSWIDPDELNALAQQLLDSQSPGSQLQVQPLPDASTLGAETLVDSIPPPPSAKPSLPALEQIRAKLRSIRDRAKSAGLLPEATPAPITPQDSTAFALATPSIFRASSPPVVQSQTPSEDHKTTSSQSLSSEGVELPSTTNTPTESTTVGDSNKEASTSAESSASPSESGNQLFRPLEGTITERLHDFCKWAINQANSQDLLVIDHHGDILWGIPSRDDLVIQSMILLNRTSSIPSHPESDALQTIDRNGKYHSVVPVTTRYGKVYIILLSNGSPPAKLLSEMRENLSVAIDQARFP